MEFACQDLTVGQLNAIVKNLGGKEGALRFLRGELVVSPSPIDSVMLKLIAVDSIVRVDRSVKPTYPNWVKKMMHPELECSGPAEYDLQTAVQQWLHEEQKYWLTAKFILAYMINSGGITTCLNLQDGLAIQAKGIGLFRKVFAGKAVFFWGSVVQDHDSVPRVPVLCDHKGSLALEWACVGVNNLGLDDPALRFGE